MLTDIEICQKARPKPIVSIAKKIKLKKKHLHLFGDFIAKTDLDILNEIKDQPQGKYILVTAMTPTPLGEGKTVTTIGLSMALSKLGKLTTTCIRQPSLGPVFGIKGGAAGGGYSQVLPMEDLNLHFTGDVHAVGLAHNLAAAFLDNHIFKGNKLSIDPLTIRLLMKNFFRIGTLTYLSFLICSTTPKTGQVVIFFIFGLDIQYIVL